MSMPESARGNDGGVARMDSAPKKEQVRFASHDFSRVLGALQKDEIFYDAVLRILGSDGGVRSELKCHRAILAAWSDVFSRRLRELEKGHALPPIRQTSSDFSKMAGKEGVSSQSQPSHWPMGIVSADAHRDATPKGEAATPKPPQSPHSRQVGTVPVVEVVTDTADVAQKVFSFMYTGKILLDASNVVQVLTIAHQCKIKPLVKMCEEYLRSGINPHNCCRLLESARAHSMEQLEASCVEFMRHCLFDAIAQSPSFLDISWKTLLWFIQRDDLRCSSEHCVFRASMAWLGADRPERQQHLEQILDCIRFVDMTDQQLVSDEVFDCQSSSIHARVAAALKMKIECKLPPNHVPRSCYLPIRHVVQNIRVRQLEEAGWSRVFEAGYCHATQVSDFKPASGRWLLLGGQRKGTDVIALAAAGRRDVIFDKGSKNDTVEENGAYWYVVPGKAIGFSPTRGVHLSSADTRADLGELRLSWHLTGDGGYRAGQLVDLNESEDWLKVIYTKPAGQCHMLPPDLLLDPADYGYDLLQADH